MGILDILKQFSPIEEEEALTQPITRAPSQAAPAPAPAPVPQEIGTTSELTADGLLSPYAQPRQANYTAPRIQVPTSDDAAIKEREGKFQSDLESLRNEYKAAQEDAASRRMKAEIFAAIGNNAGLIAGGLQGMNTKAAVSAPQVGKINVDDFQGRVDKNFKTNYDGLLKQYKDLKDGNLSAKDKLYANIAQAQLDAGAARMNANIENTDRNAGIRVGSSILKDQKDNELSDKQTESIVGFGKTSKLLGDIEAKMADGKFDKFLGPYASKYENLKEMNPLSDGMDPEFAKFQSDVTDSLSQYIKGLSGLTVSDKERVALETSMPKIGDKPQTFIAKLQATRARLQEMEKKEKEALAKYQGKNVGGYAQPKQETGTPATVERKTKDGRVAIFDAETKQFIKYKE